MPGLVPGIHVLTAWQREDVDGRVKPGHDETRRRTPTLSATRYCETVCTTLPTGRVLATGSFHVLDQRLVIFGQGLDLCLGLHLHDLVAAGLQPLSSVGRASAVCFWKSCIRMMPLPCLPNLVMTVLTICVPSLARKSKESRSQEKIATLRVPEIGHRLRIYAAVPENERTATALRPAPA